MFEGQKVRMWAEDIMACGAFTAVVMFCHLGVTSGSLGSGVETFVSVDDRNLYCQANNMLFGVRMSFCFATWTVCLYLWIKRKEIMKKAENWVYMTNHHSRTLNC